MLSHSPIIIMGMHRSGTSLLTNLLNQLGLFTGWKRDKNEEAFYFIKLNDWIMSQCDSNWSHPKPFTNLLDENDVRFLIEDYLHIRSKSLSIFNYLGPFHYFKYFSLFNICFPWGWKDPRNTFTLPLWLNVFPQAKVIHIYRHGIDVANSLYNRRKKSFNKTKDLYSKKRPLYYIFPKKRGFAQNLSCKNIQSAFDLWQEYMSMSRTNLNRCRNHYIEIQYEKLLQKPQETIAYIAQFCNLPVTSSQVQESTKNINSLKAYNYKNYHDLSYVAETNKHILQDFGY